MRLPTYDDCLLQHHLRRRHSACLVWRHPLVVVVHTRHGVDASMKRWLHQSTAGHSQYLYLKTHGSTMLNHHGRLGTWLFSWRHRDCSIAGHPSRQWRCIRAPCLRRRQQTLTAPSITHNRVHDRHVTPVRVARDVMSRSRRWLQYRCIPAALRLPVDVT